MNKHLTAAMTPMVCFPAACRGRFGPGPMGNPWKINPNQKHPAENRYPRTVFFFKNWALKEEWLVF